MKREDYDRLVRGYADEFRASRWDFEGKVRRFMALGGWVFALALVFFSGFVVLAVGLWLARERLPVWALIIGLGGLWSVGRALAMRVEYDQGLEVSRDEAPELFRRIDLLSKRLGAPRVEHVFVTDELNAAASTSGWLFLGRPRLVLSFGAPLMAFLRPEEYDSVIAHELAHHRSGDTEFSFRLYRSSAVWQQLGSRSGWLFDWTPSFARWYAPRLSAMAEVMSREREFAADRAAADAVGAEVEQGSQLRMALAWTGHLDVYKHRMAELSAESGEPPENFLAVMDAVAKGPAEASWRDLQGQLRRKSGDDDSHPSLGERLAHVGLVVDAEDERVVRDLAARYSGPLEVSALDTHLGGAEGAAGRRVAQAWREESRASWESHHRTLQRALAARGRLEAKRALAGGLARGEANDLVWSVWTVEGAKAALAVARELVATLPDDEGLVKWLANLATRRMEGDARVWIERLATIAHHRNEARELLAEYFRRAGLGDAYREVASAAWAVWEEDWADWGRLLEFGPSTVVADPLATPLEMEELRGGLSFDGVVGAWFLRMSLAEKAHVSERVAVYVGRWKGNGGEELEAKLKGHLQVDSAQVMVVRAGSREARFLEKWPEYRVG